MANKKFWLGILVIMLVFGLTAVGCDSPTEIPLPPTPIDNTIWSVSISLGYGNDPPKVGGSLSADVKNSSGDSVSGVSYQWKRADSQYSTFVNISDAASRSYTLTIDDSDKYIKVEVKNSDTAAPVLSSTVGPVDDNRAAKPTADPAGGDVVSGQKITIASATEGVEIYYTLDGTTPTSSSNLYRSYPALEITSSCTLKAIATKYGMVDSEVLSVSYTVAAAPSFSKVTSSASIFNYGIYSAAYGNSRFVAGGNAGRFAYSSDGTTWTDSTGRMDSGGVNSITYGTRFVAVSSSGKIAYSSDGISWNNVAGTTFGTESIYGVAYGDGKYVAVGGGGYDGIVDGEFVYKDGKIAYSSNGSSWTAVTDSAFGTSTIYDIAYASGKFVAVGSGGKIAYSTDGATWTAVSDSKFGTNAVYGIAYGGPAGKEKFIAVGKDYIAYSTDGITWNRASIWDVYSASGLFDGLNKITWGGNKFIAVASKGVMLYSLDGITWARIDGGTGAGKTQFDNIGYLSAIEDIVYGGGKFLAVGSKNNDIYGSGEMAISNQ
jgi:hypothetical protein